MGVPRDSFRIDGDCGRVGAILRADVAAENQADRGKCPVVGGGQRAVF